MKRVSIFTFGTWATGIYLSLVIAATTLNVLGFNRWLFGLDPDIEPNGVGDTLAGTFAPLAFLWFFVSTWLQRTELEETRRVLAEQGAELQKAAKESAEQTIIMQNTLQASRVRDIYEEHRLRLYYFTMYLSKHNASMNLSNGNTVSIFAVSDRYEFGEDNNNVDRLIEFIKIGMMQAINKLTGKQAVAESGVADFYDFVVAINKDIDDLINNPIYSQNSLISARIRGVDLNELAVRGKKLERAVGKFLTH